MEIIRMRIALIVDDLMYDSITVEECIYYNPGVGGGTYQFINLFNVLTSSNIHAVYFFHKNKTNFTDIPSILNVIYTDYDNLFESLENLHLDNIILPQRFGYDLLENFSSLGVPITYRCGNYLNSNEIEYLSKKIVKNVVCLNWEHASKYYDTSIYEKIRIIPNFINFGILETNRYTFSKTKDLEKFVITYIGSITPSKGLHLLAKVWHKIVENIPNAELNIIGSTALYGQKQETLNSNYMTSYETKVKKIFNKSPLSAVRVVYHGKLGIDKYNIIQSSDVGIVNPSGMSEVFTNSVVDFSLFDIPVLGRNRYGLVSMIEDGVNGFKFNNLRSLVNRINFIHNNKLNIHGLNFLKDKFVGRNEVYNWLVLFDYSKSQDFLLPTKEIKLKMLFHNYFFLRVLSRKIQFLIPSYPATIEIEFFLKKVYRRIRVFLDFKSNH